MKMNKKQAEQWELLQKKVLSRRGRINTRSTFEYINISLPNGSFICTEYGSPISQQLETCLEFVQGCRIGQVGPVARPKIQNLGQIIGDIILLKQQYKERVAVAEAVLPGLSNRVWDFFDSDLKRLIENYGTSLSEVVRELDARILWNQKRYEKYSIK